MNPDGIAEFCRSAVIGFPLGCVLMSTPQKGLYIVIGAFVGYVLNKIIEANRTEPQ